jgi:hypothetical protein
VDDTWARTVLNTWRDAYKARRNADYTWNWYQERRLAVRMAALVGVELNEEWTPHAADRLRSGLVRYLDACAAGTAFPAEPPTVGGFLVKAAAWMQEPRTGGRRRGEYDRTPGADRPRAMPTDAEYERLAESFDATWSET